MSDQIRHIYISPHLDDAICSCGGAIHQQTSRGEKVLVVSLFSAGIEHSEELPPYLRALHMLWGFNNTDPFAIRREEDLAALSMLGADHWHIGWRGALYRQGRDGRFLYTGLSNFGRPAQEDLRLLAQIRRLLLDLRRQYPDAIFHAPLGVGGHVDHQLAHRAARYVPGPVCFYEDIPYVFLGKISPFVREMMLLVSRVGLRGRFSGGSRANSLAAAIHRRTSIFGGPQFTLWLNRAPYPARWEKMLHPIDLPVKFDAVLQYVSQIPMLFGSAHSAWQSLENYAMSIQRDARTPMERQWTLEPDLRRP